MNTPQDKANKGHQISFLINAVVGGLMLLLSAVSYVFEMLFPLVRGTLTWPFMFTAVVCLFIASLNYSRHLSLTRRSDA